MIALGRKDPIEIVGAGPAGLTAAITLAHHGYRVVVYEARSDVGARFHGDFQGIENWSTKEDVIDLLARMGIKVNFLCHPYQEAEFYDPDRRKVTVRCRAPLFYLVRRGSDPGTLDQGLKAQALEAGVEIVFNRRVEKLPDGGIIAIGPKVADAIAKGVLFETDLSDMAAVIADDRLAPKGYAYLLAHQGRATLATVLFRRFREERLYFNRTVEAFQKLYPLGMKSPREFGGYGNFSIRPTERRGEKCYVGEAAGFQDALFGFGMWYAMTSGYLAARSIIERMDYDALWKRELLPTMKASIATDGVVVEGSSAVDESMLTGESMPVEKKPGASVIGGTLNRTGLFRFEATRVGSETALAQIIKMVEEAQASSAPIQRLADQVTAKFVPAVVSVAFLAFAGWWLAGNFPQGLLAFIAVLIIACPCALGIATPAALMVGVGKGAEAGILIRGGEVLERAERLTVVLFDKTGTLTRGEPNVTDLLPFGGHSEADVLRMAAAVEVGSEHPLGEAIVRAAKHRELDLPNVSGFGAIPGHGICGEIDGQNVLLGNRRLFNREGIDPAPVEEAMSRLESEGKTAMLVGCDGKLAGIVAVADTLKPEAKEAVAALQKERVEVVLLTGDNQRTAQAIAKEVGIREVIAEVLPGDKARVVQELQKKGKVVAMVGDGVNDAPALAAADIGIAIGSGSDVAKETGGIILVKNDVRDVVAGIRISRATMRKIKQNLFWAFIYNTIGVPVAALGYLNPILAAAAMALSSLSVIVNSATLKRMRLSVV